MNLTEAIATLLISNGIAAGIFYVIGYAHGKEDEWGWFNEKFAPPTYSCCDHCYMPDGNITNEHFHPAWEQGSNKPILKRDEHTVPCSEPGCFKGQVEINVVRR